MVRFSEVSRGEGEGTGSGARLCIAAHVTGPFCHPPQPLLPQGPSAHPARLSKGMLDLGGSVTWYSTPSPGCTWLRSCLTLEQGGTAAGARFWGRSTGGKGVWGLGSTVTDVTICCGFD